MNDPSVLIACQGNVSFYILGYDQKIFWFSDVILLCYAVFSWHINPMSSVTFLYPLKTSENLRFADVFKRYKNVLDINRLKDHQKEMS